MQKLLIAIAIVPIIAHNLIPHHHHETETVITEHYHHAHSHDHESAGLSDIFSHFIHSNESYVIVTGQQEVLPFKEIITFLAVNYFQKELLIPPIWHMDKTDNFITNSHYFLPSGLRAPPAC